MGVALRAAGERAPPVGGTRQAGRADPATGANPSERQPPKAGRHLDLVHQAGTIDDLFVLHSGHAGPLGQRGVKRMLKIGRRTMALSFWPLAARPLARAVRVSATA